MRAAGATTAPRIALIAGILLLAACAGAAFVDFTGFARVWLAVSLFWLALPLGALAILSAHRITGGAWGVIAVPVARATAATLPVPLAAFIVPLAVDLGALFAWTAPEDALPEVVRQKTLYLNAPFFTARTLACFALWLALAWRLEAWTRPRLHSAALGPVAAIVWVLTVTFFSFDWLMSLEPEWYSDIFGLYFAAQAVLAALAWVLLVAWLRRGKGDTAGASGPKEDLANLLLVFVLGWLFLHFVQYLIIWMANMPDEIGWFIHRSENGWWIIAGLVLFLFALFPFAVLISGNAKRRREPMIAVTVSILAAHLLQSYWLVIPTFHPEGVSVGGIAPAAWLGIGAVWTFVLMGRLAAIERETGEMDRLREGKRHERQHGIAKRKQRL